MKKNMVSCRRFWAPTLECGGQTSICVNPSFRKVERIIVTSSTGLGAMKRTTVLYTACLSAFVSMACSQGGPAASGGPTAGAPAMTAGAGGGVVVGAGAGGAPIATAGAPSAGAGTEVGGAGGAPAVAGSGGAPDAGGSAGQPGTAGSGTAGGSAGGAGGLTAADIVPDLQGYYWEGTCQGSIAVEGHNCPMSDTFSSCPSNGINREKTVMVKGVAGQLYTINIEVRGVIGTRCYTGGTRASTAALNENGDNNWWYSGGTVANPTGWWNTYELHVSPSTGDASGDVYYFNGSDVQGGNSCEREATYLVNYKASFKVKGGGTLTFKIHDQNCKGQQNCGSNPDGTSACVPRTVNLTGMAATPPANFVQPPTNNTYKPQWMLIGVTSITSP